jgi:hypothetical protein
LYIFTSMCIYQHIRVCKLRNNLIISTPVLCSVSSKYYLWPAGMSS